MNTHNTTAARGTDKVRLLIADPLFGCRLSLELAASDDPHVEVVGACANGIRGAQVADEVHPAAIIVDVSTPTPDGTDVVSLLHAVCPDARIVVWSDLAQVDARDAAIRHGAAAVFDKSTRSELVVEAATQVGVLAGS